MTSINASEFFIFGFTGERLPTKVKNYLEKNSCGGVILFKHNIASLKQVLDLNSQLISSQPEQQLIISVDQEGGRVARLRGITTNLPPMNKFACEKPDHIYRIGALMGRELGVLGFNLNFAPVCDILTNNKNKVIGDRSFSHNPQIAAQLSSEFISGMQGAGVGACAKHFPGHGDSHHDTHTQKTHVKTNISTLQKRELVPFLEAIKNNVASIMTSHVIYNQLDSKYPATLSYKIITKILREKLNFSNLVISDDLNMKAVSNNFSLEEILELGLRSGINLFIIGNDFEKFLHAQNILQKIISSSPVLQKLAQESVERIKIFKNRYVGKPSIPKLKQALKIIRCQPHLDLISNYQ